MKQFNQIYEANKELDELFDNDFCQTDKKIIQMNIIELLVEIGELANEVRCFKYWSIKKPSAKEIILEEYADGLMMIMAFSNILELSLEEISFEIEEKDINDQFLYIYKIAANLPDNFNKKYLKNLFANFIYLGYLLEFNDNDIINGVLKKISKDKVRLKEQFIN